MPSPMTAGTKEIPVPTKKKPSGRALHSLWRVVLSFFYIAYQARAGVYFDIFLFALVGIYWERLSLTIPRPAAGDTWLILSSFFMHVLA